MSGGDVIAGQQAALHDLYRQHVGPGDHYALLDFPDHANVGDSAIWLGEIALLRGITGRDPDYVCTWDGADGSRFEGDTFRQACPEGVVFLHGGGNLGDIWPHHQRFREAVVGELRDRRIVQLPQSIHFRVPAGAARFAELIAAHPDFHLCVRDQPSFDFTQRRFDCPVTLAPDSAFALGRRQRGAPDCDVLMLMRTDDERIVHDGPFSGGGEGIVRLDWLEDDTLPVADPTLPRSAQYERLAAARVERGLAMLSRGRRIVTDRLHAHILALLLDIPHVALDNDYGKLSAYIAAWTAGSPLLHRA